VILNPERPIRGLDDSKQLTPERRAVLAARIRERGLAWSVGACDAFEVDRWNILQASRVAMRRAVARLTGGADFLLVDATHIDLDVPQRALIHGDSLSFSIAAASILAKVARDRAMQQWGELLPGYDLASNKGYGSPKHLTGLERQGPTQLHRFSFAPVRERARPSSWTGYPALRSPEAPSGDRAEAGRTPTGAMAMAAGVASAGPRRSPEDCLPVPLAASPVSPSPSLSDPPHEGESDGCR
jgi:ribonuclease HII